MNIELNNSFYTLDVYNTLQLSLIRHLTFKELKNDPLLKILFREFVDKVLKEECIWGRNKLSNDLNSLNDFIQPDLVQKIHNFNTFQDHKFKHYHLVDSTRRNDTNIGKISDIKDNSNTCGTLVHYQLLDNKIIIHSIGKHESGEWTELFKLINPKYSHITMCDACGIQFTTYKDLNCPSCASNPLAPSIPNTTTFISVGDTITFGESVIVTVTETSDPQILKDKKSNDDALKAIMLTADLFKENINSKDNKVISSIEELNHELDKI